jgi:hypothetical protein
MRIFAQRIEMLHTIVREKHAKSPELILLIVQIFNKH